MSTKNNNAFILFFTASIFITLVGAMLKLMHWPFSQPVLLLGLMATLGYMILGIVEVNRSQKIKQSEKVMWSTSFIFFGFFAAIAYLLFGRKRMD